MSDAETSHLEQGLESHIPIYGSAEGKGGGGGGRVHGFLLITFLNLPMQRNPLHIGYFTTDTFRLLLRHVSWSFIKAQFNNKLI